MNRQQAFVASELFDELVHWCTINRILNDVVDPRLPAPEVFERPGWRLRHVHEGCRVVVASPPERYGPKPADTTIPAEVRSEEDIAEPLVTADVIEPGGTMKYGLGIHVPSRTYFLFRLGRAK